MANSPSAMRLAQLMGCLPDGVAHVDLDTILPGAGDEAASVLRKQGLAFDDGDRLLMLQPIREHMEARHPPQVSDLGKAIRHYARLAIAIGEFSRKRGGATAANERYVAESGNLMAMLLAGFADVTDPGSDLSLLVNAVLALTGRTQALLIDSRPALNAAIRAATKNGEPGLKAQLLKGLGDAFLDRFDHKRGQRYYHQALKLFKNVGDIKGQADSAHRLGDTAHARLDPQDADRLDHQIALLLVRSRTVHMSDKCPLRRIDDAQPDRDHNADEAERWYRQALGFYRDLGDTLGQANCVNALGDVARFRNDLDRAEENYRGALPLFARVGYMFGQACSLAGLGYVALLRCDHDEAEQKLLSALDFMVRVGYVLGQAYCTVGLGHIALHRGDYARAERSFHQALASYEQLKDEHSIGRMRRYLAQLQGGRSAIRTVPATLMDNNGSLRLISVFRADPQQVGDRAAAPMNYADALGLPWLSASEVLDIGDSRLQEEAGDLHRAVVIVGGGGLGFTDFQPNLRWIALQRPAVLIWWGAGRNAHFGRGIYGALADSFDRLAPSVLNYPQVLSREYFQLIGVRDSDGRNGVSSGYQWVPCVSAMHSAFDEPVQRTDEVRVYSHKDPLYDLGTGVRMITNATRPENNVAAPGADATFEPASFPVAGDAATAIHFIRSAGVLITNSFHGAYWAQLADVPVALFAEFSTKFRLLPNRAPIVTVEQVRSQPEAVVDAARKMAASQQTTPGTLLRVARSANIAFAEQFSNLLADRLIQVAAPQRTTEAGASELTAGAEPGERS